MAAKGFIEESRFAPGTKVALIEVDSVSTLRAEDGRHETKARKKVGEDGIVRFDADPAQPYILRGWDRDGAPLDVRRRGQAADEDPIVLSPGVARDRVRFGVGGAYSADELEYNLAVDDMPADDTIVEELAGKYDAEVLAQAASLAAARQPHS